MERSAYFTGREYMERFSRIKARSEKALDRYEKALDDLRPSTKYSPDRIQSGKISDPTPANAMKLIVLQDMHERAADDYDRALDDLDRRLSAVKDPTLRTIIVLYYIDGRSVAEIAGALVKKGGGAYSPETISNLKHKALVEIGKRIKKEPQA